MNSLWQVNSKAPDGFLKQFPEYPDFVLQLLWDRNIKTQEQIDEFFNPDYEIHVGDPFLIKGIKEAVYRIERAVQSKEKIVVYGDYDTDGICAATILYETCRVIGARGVDVYIPDRFKEGYGLNLKSVEELARSGTKLLITVDCGITDYAEIDLANSLGMDVIVTDHHLVPEEPLKAFAVIDSKQKDDCYPFKDLVGAGVAFKLAQSLLKSRRDKGAGGVPAGWEKWLIDIAAIATIADLQPLVGENRTLVKYGLIVVEKTRRLGLKELIKISGLADTVIDSWRIGFILAPRLNAAGRINHAEIGFRLLTTESTSEAEVLAKKLDSYNKERQALVAGIVKEIQGILDGQVAAGQKLPKLIFEGSESVSAGTTGLVASKIKDQLSRPCMIYTFLNGQIRGTGRSIPGFNLVEAMKKCDESHPGLFVEYGGHALSAGFTVKNENLETFKKLLQDLAEKQIGEEAMVPKLDIDMEVPAHRVNWEFYEWLKKFEPFGVKNRQPVFLMRGLEIEELRMVGNGGRHLKMKLAGSDSKRFSAIGFGLGEAEKNLRIGSKIDAAFELSVDEWNGSRDLQLRIIDLKIAVS